ncbi:neutral ceramidase-like [Tribolium castaneum]|nr:PREDICTED: neutral ceramidase-like [Tribolium castaneum]|eukprot:XP_008198655.1 PREDICTED: neutral ceramidase-like [Tribolium castaneum]
MIKILALLTFFCYVSADYQVGIGRADCTGPPAEIIFMGYAKLSQVGCGLHLRQFARAYIIDDGTSRAAFVTVDALAMAHSVRRQVLKNLAELYNDTYTEQNLIISGTHTHSTPGGWFMDLMLDIPVLGFVQESFDTLVEGITQAITNAHENMVEAKIFLSSGILLDANINRSPASYLYNPEEERAKYEYNVDKEMVQLKFVRSSDTQPIGVINWFAVHPTSMNNTNCLLTSDNVGYASLLLEDHVNNGTLPGKGSFVGAFASTNLGDVSPNTKGPICIDTGEECDFITSTCNGNAQTCIASGPGNNMAESTQIIAGKLFNKAKELFHQEDTFEVTGPVKFIHQYVDMPNEKATITLANGTQQEIRGCLPAMGYSFAGGTTDGPGEFDFAQGTTTDNPFWDAVRDFVFPPTEDEIACHAPKPILINTGGVDFPYPWQPRIVTTQIVTVGEVALIAVPGEFTTMSGRRLRDAVKETIISNGGSENTRPIITGLSNVYTNYIATPEEYQLQRYEGGSTIYGPQTLNLYINKFKQLATALMKGETLDSGPTPPDFSSQLITLVSPPSVDGIAQGQNFGDCLQQPPESVSIGDTVSVKFVSGNPRHDVLHGGTYISVEKSEGDDWVLVASDANWETRFHWKRTNVLTGESEVTIEWDIGQDVVPGQYRIRHNGHYKEKSGEIHAYEGITSTFKIA